MKNFLMTFLACVAAIFASMAILFMISMTVMVGLIASLSTNIPVTTVSSNSILQIELNEQISDNPSTYFINNFDPYSMSLRRGMSLLQVISAIDHAADDDDIKGIYLNINPNMNVGLANAEEIRDALIRFKDNGKFIVSYADYYTQMSYYISSVADHLYLNPEGDLDWKGMSSQVMFFKGTLDKLGIVPEIFRSGEYKSAVEPFMYDKMSPESRSQMTLMVNGIWGEIVSKVSESRDIDSLLLQKYASGLMVSGSRSAIGCNMIDGAVHSDYVMDILAGMTESDEPSFVPLGQYIYNNEYKSNGSYSNIISVIYAEGDIVDGKAREGEVSGKELAARIAKVRKDSDVKAVVFRVNSPGGSALASEIIWNELALLREEKPVIVSMGNYAASGGYYISAPADLILANKSTITGSIGVFGLMINAEKALKDKLGITVDVVKTNPSADVGTAFRAPTTAEKRYYQNRVDEIYSSFVDHVSQGRNLSREEVLKIGSGRVWSGLDSYDIGLVDGFGGIKDAIMLAADRAGIMDDFSVVPETDHMESFTEILRNLFNGKIALKLDNTPALVKEYDKISRITEREGIQAMMPFRMTFE